MPVALGHRVRLRLAIRPSRSATAWLSAVDLPVALGHRVVKAADLPVALGHRLRKAGDLPIATGEL